MTPQEQKEQFDNYSALRKIHQEIFGVLEEYRRQHDNFRFAVRKIDTKRRLTYGMIFKGDGNYIAVGLTNEGDTKNKTPTVYLNFGIQDNRVKELSLWVTYSAVGDADQQKRDCYANLCRALGTDPRIEDNGRRIRTKMQIPMDGNDWHRALTEWLDQNFKTIENKLNNFNALLSKDAFKSLLQNQVGRNILRCTDNGYEVNNDYTPNFESVVPDGLQQGEVADDDNDNDDDGDDGNYETGDLMVNLVRNKIVFGAPGTGKSRKLKNEVNTNFLDKDGAGKVIKERYERVTFYPTYSYAQFVGTYKPVMKPRADGAAGEEIAYEFVPGPFLRVLVNALNEPDKNRCLVIEEINRANAAAVFGDVFQLLDRASEDDDEEKVKEGESEYAIAASEDVKKHLDKALTESGKKALRELTGSIDSLKIPSNMYIWATMNSADQGVFPMDTAFKRRWEFEYIPIDNGKEDCAAWTIEGKTYNWNKLREFINVLLSLHGVNEDKLMGAHFVKAMGNFVPDKAFKSKVLMYLWEDAARMIRRQMFGNILTYSQLCDEWQRIGIKVFENDSELKKAKDDSPLKKSYEELKEPATSSGATDQHPADTDTGHQENPE